MMAASFVPMGFAAIYLGTIEENDKYEDDEGYSGITAGVFCILFAMSHSVAIMSKSVDLCKVLILARASLGIVAIFVAGYLAVVVGEKALFFSLLYFLFALFSLPEAFLLISYAEALGRAEEQSFLEEESAFGDNWASGPPAFLAPPSYPTSSAGTEFGMAPAHWGSAMGPPQQAPPPYFQDGMSRPMGGGGDFGLGPSQNPGQYTGPASYQGHPGGQNYGVPGGPNYGVSRY